MRHENNRTCLVCGKKYTYCPSCEEDAHKPTWLALYCSENCKKIFMTVTDLHGDDLTVEDAVKVLNTCDMSAKANFNPNLVADIDEIYFRYNDGKGEDPVKKIVAKAAVKSAAKAEKAEKADGNTVAAE